MSRSNRCDCGAWCSNPRLGCDRCRYLDGTYPGEARVIGALRLVGKGAAFEIAEMTGMNPTHVCRIFRRLRENGRIKYLHEERLYFETNSSRGRVGSTRRHYYELRSP